MVMYSARIGSSFSAIGSSWMHTQSATSLTYTFTYSVTHTHTHTHTQHTYTHTHSSHTLSTHTLTYPLSSVTHSHPTLFILSPHTRTPCSPHDHLHVLFLLHILSPSVSDACTHT